jgi:hypothetical protein
VRLLPDEHFDVDGALIEAGAVQKSSSIRPRPGLTELASGEVRRQASAAYNLVRMNSPPSLQRKKAISSRQHSPAPLLLPITGFSNRLGLAA